MFFPSNLVDNNRSIWVSNTSSVCLCIFSKLKRKKGITLTNQNVWVNKKSLDERSRRGAVERRWSKCKTQKNMTYCTMCLLLLPKWLDFFYNQRGILTWSHKTEAVRKQWERELIFLLYNQIIVVYHTSRKLQREISRKVAGIRKNKKTEKAKKSINDCRETLCSKPGQI